MSGTIKVIILVVIFLVILYLYTFWRIRRRKEITFNSVEEYREQYLNHKTLSERRKDRITHYVTKYNSSEDYREK